MANYFLNDDGSLTKKNKKKKGNNYILQDDGKLVLEKSDYDSISTKPSTTSISEDLNKRESELLKQVNNYDRKLKREWWDNDEGFLDNAGNVLYKLFAEKQEDRYVKDEKYDELVTELNNIKKQKEEQAIAKQKEKGISGLDKVAYTIVGNVETAAKGVESTATKILGGTPKVEDPSYNEKMAQISREQSSGLGKVGLDVVGSVSRMLPNMLVGNPTGAMAMGFANYGGGAYNEAIRDGYTDEQATKYGLVVGTLEMALEKALGGFESIYGKSLAGNFTNKVMGKLISNPALRKAASGMAGEFTEEYLQEFLEPIVKNTILEEENGADFWNTMKDDFGEGLKQLGGQFFNKENLYAGMLGAITSGVVGAPSNIDAYVYNKKTGRDIETGLTPNEQKIIDKEVETRKQEAQKEGKKLSKKEIAKIEEQVKNDLFTGNLNTTPDTEIETTEINKEQSVENIDNQIIELEKQLETTENDAEYERIANQIRVLEEQANQLEQQDIAPVRKDIQNTQQAVETQNNSELEKNSNLEYNKIGDLNVGGFDRRGEGGIPSLQESSSKIEAQTIQGERRKGEARSFSREEYTQFEERAKSTRKTNLTETDNKIATEVKERLGKEVVFFDEENPAYKGGASLTDPNIVYISDSLSENGKRYVAYHETVESTITHNKDFYNKYLKSAIEDIMNDPNFEKTKATFKDGDIDLDNASDFAIAKDILSDYFAEKNTGVKTPYEVNLTPETIEMLDYISELTSREISNNSTQEIAPINIDEGTKKRAIRDRLQLSMQDNSSVNNITGKEKNVNLVENIPLKEDIAPIKQELSDLTSEIKSMMKDTKKEIKSLKKEINEVKTDINETVEEIRALTEAEANERDAEQNNIQSFTDEDIAPIKEDTTPEADDEITATKSLEDVRDFDEIGSRKVKAYQYENPEVRPYFQEMATYMLGDLENSVKGERNFNDQLYYDTAGEQGFYGTTRQTTEDIAELLDSKYNYTYKDIRKGLEAIIKDHGAENIAVAKRIELALDKRLREGYTDVSGYEMPANEDYLKLMEAKEITDNYNNLPIDESMIPVDNTSNTQINENIAPVKESKVNDSGQGVFDLGIVKKLNAPEGEIKNKPVEPIDLSKAKQLTIDGTEENLVTKTKKELRKALLGTEAQKEFILGALDNAKNRSMALMNNTDTIRNTELVFGRDAGSYINEVIFQKEIDNEADSIAWQNKERDEIKALGIKARSKESAAVQKYGEKQYVNDVGEVVEYGDKELISEFSDAETREKIKRAAQVIRNKYDNYIDRANEVLTKLGFDAIPKRKDYMRHFQELNDVFSRYGIPFNAQNMTEHVLPTDINGLTENWSPQKNYFANTQRRTGVKTTYDAITGVDGYIGGIANLIYHTEDIQRGRAFEELIRETYGEDKGFENLDNLPDELKQARAEKIQDNHLSNYAAWLHEWTNNVAGKKHKIDRSVESLFGRKAFSFLDGARKQVGSNMIGFNLSSSLTNLIAPVQATAKTNKLAVLKGTADTIKNMFIKDDFMSKNKFLTARMGTDMISKNAWQKMQDAGFIFMKGMDWFSSNQIVRSKFYELRAKGMSEQQAHAEAGKFAARILGDRTKGANAQLYNSKLVGLVTQFQLEVNNQLYSQFYDTYHESKEAARGNALKTAAGMTFTLGQLFALTHLFGQTFEAIAGYNPTFDVIEMIKTAFGWGEDDDEEKTTSERLKSAADQLVDALPYVNILTGGGRIPVTSGIPNLVGVATGGKDQYGNELTLEDELKKLLFLVPPTGGNQLKKTYQGLSMFDEDLPISGSYTDSGNLRFPVEDTIQNRIQASLFGQYASENARYYFDNELAPLKEKQIEEFIEMDIPYKEYIEYRKDLAEVNKTKADKDEDGNAISGTAAGKKAYQIMNGNYSKKEKERLLEGLSSETYRITTSDLDKLNNNEELYKYYFSLTTKNKSDFINAIKNYGFDAETLYEANTVIKNIEDNYSKLNNNGNNLTQQKKQAIKNAINQYTTTEAQYNYLYHKIYKK